MGGILMLLGIMADVHLGAKRFRKQTDTLENAFYMLNLNAFDEAYGLLKNAGVQYVLIAGDLFESPNPDVRSILFVNKILDKWNIPTLILGGNHDHSRSHELNGFHSFDLITSKMARKVHLKAEVVDLNENVKIACLPYQCINEQGFAEVHGGDAKILLAHGYVNLNNDKDADMSYAIPVSVAEQYQLVVVGHNHLAHVERSHGKVILTPGSLTPSPKSVGNGEFVYTYDTNTHQLNSLCLKGSPKVFSGNVDNLNEFLAHVEKNGIYSITYAGNVKDLDEGVYQQARAKALAISIQTYNEDSEIAVQVVPEFWDFVQKNHREWVPEFKGILEEVRNE
jgi:DNA repair exonuclease SbcCD nuclease subunit